MDTGVYNIGEDSYLRLLNNILAGKRHVQTGRNGVTFYGGHPCMLNHHFIKTSQGSYTFPLMTTKAMQIKNVAIELEFFLKGFSNVSWLEERGCNIWTPWKKYDGELGPVYGVQWNRKLKNGLSQIENIMSILKSYKTDDTVVSRRLLVNSWNVAELSEMVLPPCHFAFQLNPTTVENQKFLSLVWYQRSADMCIGVPYNIASYALLLLIICKILDYTPGCVTGFFANPHIYCNQVTLAEEQIGREILESPFMSIPNNIKSLKEWDYTNIKLTDYKPHKAIKYPVTI